MSTAKYLKYLVLIWTITFPQGKTSFCYADIICFKCDHGALKMFYGMLTMLFYTALTNHY